MTPPPQDHVKAVLTYTVDSEEQPVAATTGPGRATFYPKGATEERTVDIYDARALSNELSLNEHGFQIVQHQTAMVDFHDSLERRNVYEPEIEHLLASLLGPARLVVFDHTLRHGDEAIRKVRQLREPVKVIHNDYTDWSGTDRVRHLLPDEADVLLQHRFAIVQVWRPIPPNLLQHPLAICDARTIAMGDLIPTERRHPDRVGEIYHLAYNPAHRWYYVPEMRREEALVFKTFDSATDGRARFTAHASFDDPRTPPLAPPRESIEVRVLAFFDS